MQQPRTVEIGVGRTYFHAAFYDDALTVPRIDTYVYVGRDDTDGTHLFQDAYSYLETQKGREPDDGYLISFADGEIEWIFDVKGLVEWLQDDHSPTNVATETTYVFV
ncbi:MAG: hypothetical protein QNJ00_14800 [Woeseiaceae bacterium]|nr:hypothetical protein [Woeseiaceae bacterium]